MKPLKPFANTRIGLALLGLLLTPGVRAQTNTGVILGTVTDPTGAVVPRAQILISNTDLQVTAELETNAVGAYVSPVLRAGPYEIRVEASGFQAVVRRNIVLHVNDHLEINFELQPGAVTEVVEVTTASPLLETQSGDVGLVIEERTILDLPLDGRRYIDLMLLAPGVLPAPGVFDNPREGRFNVNGNLSLQNYFILNGADNNSFTHNIQDRSPQVARPPPDALRELKIQTRTYEAEFGFAMGAIVNVEIKSGSNEFHGAGWYFHRNDDLNATNFFANRSGLEQPFEIRNQVGFAVGGPAVRDWTYWFFDYGYTDRNKGETAGATVPTALWRTGDFSEQPIPFDSTNLANLIAAVPEQLPCLTLDDPVNPTHLLGLNLGATDLRTDGRTCLDPVGAALVDLYPLPTGPGLFEFQGAPKVPIDQHSFDIRIDQKVSDKDNVYGTFSFFDNERVIGRGAFENPLAPGGFSATSDLRTYHLSTSWVHIFNPTVVNTFRFGWNQVNSILRPLAPEGNAGPDFGLTGLPDNFAFGLPPIKVAGFQVLGTNSWRPQISNSQVWQLLDNLSYLRGKHQFKFGFEYKRVITNFLDIRAPNGEIDTGGRRRWVRDGVANLLLGNVSRVRVTSAIVPHRYVDSFMFYGQDSWRATPTLTLNYGVRYEYFTPWIERDRLTSNFDPEGAGGRGQLLTTFAGTLPTTTLCTFECLVQVSGDSIFERTLIHPDRNNWAPRFSFAWTPWDRIVLRGGAAIFYQAIDRSGNSANLQLNPPFFFETVQTATAATDPPVFQLRDGFPALLPPTGLGDPTSLFLRGAGPDSVTPYSVQWSLGPQIKLPRGDMAVEIAYVGQKANKLRKLLDISQGSIVTPGVGPVVFPFPDWGTIGDYQKTIGNSNYHSMQINLRKRYSRGLMFNAAYTYGKVLGDSGETLSGGSSSSSQINPQDINNLDSDYGPLRFDQTHHFVANWQWELPFGPGQPYLNQGLKAKLLGDWQFNGIWSSTSGVPISITARDASGTRSSNRRADCLAAPSGPATVDQWRGMFPGSPFFARPASFTFGTCGVGTLRGWAHHRGDFSLFKKFRIDEARWLELRFEFFNVFNTPQFSGVTNNVNRRDFGRTLRVNDPDRDARVIQLGAKIYF